MKIPNLFIIGTPKAGTTSLHYYLSQHPDIFMSTFKEPHHFCTDLYNESVDFHGKNIYYKYMDDNKYLELFEQSSNEKLIGESSTSYIFSFKTPSQIYKFNSDAKIIILLRDPTSYLYSLHAQLLETQNETVPCFEKALELEPHRKKGLYIPTTVREPSLLYYTEMIKYAEHIQNYLDVFPIKNIKIILFDDFKKNTEREYTKVLDFLGVKRFTPDYGLQNSRTRPKNLFLQRLLRDPKLSFKEPLRKLLPKQVQQKIYDTLFKLNTKKVHDKINPETQRRLKQQFKTEVAKTNNLLHEHGLIDDSVNLLELWDYQ